ncbi:MAG: restriction endonuclease subunit S [Bacteroidales bacterium]|nr:restriction endonuclease subunit S [Bacteroidales bacterium]
MKKRISDIARIQTGIYAKPNAIGEVIYILGRHINQDKQIDPIIFPELQLNEKTKKHLLHEGDIILASKGHDLSATVFYSLKFPAVASSMFLVLRLVDPKVTLPEYVAWSLNHSKTQRVLLGYSKGTSLQSITKDIIGNLEIQIPSVHKQRALLNAIATLTRETQLKRTIELLKNQIMQQKLLKAISE